MNILYVTVVVCAPGSTTNCQAIDHVQVDTGSYGLRVLSQALQPALAAALPAVSETQTGQPLVECTAFADGYSWGPIRSADMQIAGEKDSGLEIQVIGDPTYSTVPADCSSNGNQEDTVAQFGANGILGVGPFVPDCGSGCTPTGGAATGVYYVCPSPASCTDSGPPAGIFKGVMLNQQMSNPVAFFANDNNGVIINLAPVSQGGAANLQGQLIFGIDTAANNAMTAANVLPTDQVNGYITTLFNGGTYGNSYIDSGSNAYYFIDSTLPQCTSNKGFYCPASEMTLSATNEGYTGTPQSNVSFHVGNADSLSISNSAFDDLAGCPVSPTSTTCPSSSKSFDWGLPFFFGQPIYTVIACQLDGATCKTTTKGFGPYFAY